jgi:predicted transglutaminase-like cysteine proteinase
MTLVENGKAVAMGNLRRPLLVAASLILTACAGQADIEESIPIPLGAAAKPPHGYTDFCNREPEECQATAGKHKKTLALSKGRWFELNTVNAMVNHLIVPVTDEKLYGLNEYWTYPIDSGDCEDYALLKRKDLIERGWPAESLLMTVGFDSENRAHAVLMVATKEGDYVLDNLTDEILPWWAAPYDWSIRQSEEDPMQWVRLRPAELSVDVASTKSRGPRVKRPRPAPSSD